VLFSSHVLTEVEQVCDRVGVLRRGRIVHVQDMKELREAHLIRVCFSGRPPDCLPELPGLTLQERGQEQLTLEYAGPLPPLVEWLGRQALADLRLEPLGLSAIYRRYHGDKD
jgi:ABC-2 type transport system ATP-binding protein